MIGRDQFPTLLTRILPFLQLKNLFIEHEISKIENIEFNTILKFDKSALKFAKKNAKSEQPK